MAEQEDSKKNVRYIKGKVVSDTMAKSIVILVESLVLHRRFKKYIKRSNKIMADDPNNEAKNGDIVLIQESRPISKRKRHKLSKVLETN